MAKEDKKAAEAAPSKPKKKLILLIAVALLVLGLGGGAAWYFLKGGKHGSEEQKVSANLSAQPIFVSLEPFTVNLQREQGDQVLQVGLSFKFYNQDLNDKIKNAMPEIRSNLLLLLSSKHASELISVEGKKKLAREIIKAVNTILGIREISPKMSAAGPAVTVASPTTAAEPAAASPASGQANPEPAATTASQAAATQVATSEEEATKSREGIVDVLFTSFIIQ